MLNRRFLRVKVLQGLYSFFQTEDANVASGEKDIFKSIERFFDLYLHMLALLVEIRNFALEDIELKKQKRLPTDEDLNPNMKFVENEVFAGLLNNIVFNKLLETKKISWHLREDIVKKMYKALVESDGYAAYMSNDKRDFNEDKKFLADFYREVVVEEELIGHFFEDESIYWPDDIDLVDTGIVKTINQMKRGSEPGDKVLLDLYKDEADDRDFVKQLFRKTCAKSGDYSLLIEPKIKNWEIDRIALLDIILMKMAICEFEHFEAIPVKVTLNEYIELAKFFSTPKSNMFINGVLDKLVEELKAEGRIKKIGRGLIDK